ncbi:helix-turn-helix transcriptional regulator [Nocardia cyriacigeorgica]|uniref:Helix-turn-helix transcriptional regulator n=1 Tax=Nocardia cyriacigeorgica TaxID=135487 RepID=A0A5R8NY70_9NOCA|nr:AAA family ATPase [Nocardia cyriacigeorgica]TLF81076.1 helix-turn-helix transcriptional regulator [Nocardia cyriacigeorgica]
MLHGREAEQAEIDRLLDAARAGRSGTLVLRGDPGIGKTALLDYAAAQGIPAARSAGIESEAELPFAGLHMLVRPGMELVERLPAQQRDALRGAFGLAPRDPGDRMLIGLAVLTLLAEESADGPLLCLIDDAHWLDRATAEALLFAARRLDAEGVVMLFATRAGAGDFPAPGIPELRLTGLRQEAAAALIDSTAPDLAPVLRYRLLTEAAGNPLALRELPAVLAAEAPEAGPNPLPLTDRLRLAFHGQISGLPEPTSTLLLVAAAAHTADLSTVLRAAETLGAQVSDLRPAEEASLVHSDGSTLVFRHPMLRSAVYQSAGLSRRLQAHRALAAVSTAPEDADLRAWHLAAAATGPDESAAAALEATAERARVRSGYHGAVAAYERAADLSTDAEARVRRLVLAAETAVEAGQFDRARLLAERAAAHGSDESMSARLDAVRGIAEFGAGRPRTAHELLLSAADGTADPARAARILAQAVHAAWYVGAGELAEVAERVRALRLPAADPMAPIIGYLLAATLDIRPRQGAQNAPASVPEATVRTSTSLDRERGDQPVPEARTERRRLAPPLEAGGAAPRADTPADSAPESAARSTTPRTDLRVAASAAQHNGADSPRDLVQMCGAGLVVGADEQVGELARELLAQCREQGRIALLPPLLFFRAEAELFLGRPRESRVAAAEGLRIAEDIGNGHWVSQLCGFLAYLGALEGSETECGELVAKALAEDLGGPDAAGATWTHAALGLLDLGFGRVDGALSRLAALTVEPARHQVIGLRVLPDLVEAAVRGDDPGRAEAARERLTTWADRTGADWIAALAHRARALTAADATAEHHFRAALAPAGRPFDTARTQLLFGEWLRRDKRKTEARTLLESAAETFDRLGFAPWAQRARTELAALGVGAAARPAHGLAAALTPQELQIARLAAQGMSNREIAAQLVLSPRTVGHHLYKAYPKLGVVSRGELADLPLGPE